MSVLEDSILQILAIAHKHSRAGSGLALRDLIANSGFVLLRPKISATDIERVLAKRADLARDWVHFSEDKRTSGGWALVQEGSEWIVRGSKSKHSTGERLVFPSLSSACAEYVLRELDFWAALKSSPPNSAA
jgi:hypothetical protein